MKINKISLYNFNSFEGLNEFDFSIEDSKKNIILIGGKNGAGKTSLFTAIKIALYGPLAFGYIGSNPHYIAKVKDFINSRAFQKNKVESWVQITVSFMVERDIKDYEITRKWEYSGQKLTESYYVKSHGEWLTDQEISYFQNYLQSVVPPDLFEFFLFDGEAVGSIFSSSSYNSYIRNAVYTLCGLDIYEIIRKYTRGYAGKASTEDEEKLFGEYEDVKKAVEDAEKSRDKIYIDIESRQRELDQLETELIELETAFKKAGGITESERKNLRQDYEKAERIKVEAAAKIKLFVEGIMPFYIVRDFTDNIKKQLDYEEKGEIFNYIQQRLNRNEIQSALAGTVSDSSVDTLIDMLLEKFRPNGFHAEAQPVHDLSKEDTGRVNAVISTLQDFDFQEMIRTVQQKLQASDRTMEINKTLKSAMADEEANEFAERENALLKKKSEVNQKLFEEKNEMEQILRRLEILEQQRNRIWNRIKDNSQNKRVLELSNGLSRMMDTLLGSKTARIKEQLENMIVENLHSIYRKNNLITHIEIDDSFQFNLYQDAIYTGDELAYLMKNLGKQGFASMIGEGGQRLLFEKYGVDTLNQLQKTLSFHPEDTITLYQNIDLSRLSKGERQIFILSMYWAIIKLSGQDIPFVIDTPYARIDANHRMEISEKFFPNISKQVIILSTDEEINEEYYKIIKPYVAKEYLLINDENQNRTSIENHYFFEV